MQRQTAQQGQGLAGTERYGAVHGIEVIQMLPSHIQPGVEPATPSGVKYGKRDSCVYIREDGEKCRAPKKRGHEFCVGHSKRVAKQNAAKEKEEALDSQE